MCEVYGEKLSIFIIQSVLGVNNYCLVFRFKDTMTNTVGHRNTEIALELGLLYNPSDALKIGLVDQLVSENDVLATATQTMAKWLTIPGILHAAKELKISK